MKKIVYTLGFATVCLLGLSGCTKEAAVSAGTGTGGSMARFTIVGDQLYTVDSESLNVYNIEDLSNPSFRRKVELGVGIETIFPFQQHLFIGSQNGMDIYSITNPEVPTHVSTFTHMQSCDPVVADATHAFVTLRGGNNCGQINSQLNVLDINDLFNPQEIGTYWMTEPYGLALSGNTLYVCDGNAGLRVFDATDRASLIETAWHDSIHTYDAIAHEDLLMVIGEDGLHQYDISDPLNLVELAAIPF